MDYWMLMRKLQLTGGKDLFTLIVTNLCMSFYHFLHTHMFFVQVGLTLFEPWLNLLDPVLVVLVQGSPQYPWTDLCLVWGFAALDLEAQVGFSGAWDTEWASFSRTTGDASNSWDNDGQQFLKIKVTAGLDRCVRFGPCQLSYIVTPMYWYGIAMGEHLLATASHASTVWGFQESSFSKHWYVGIFVPRYKVENQFSQRDRLEFDPWRFNGCTVWYFCCPPSIWPPPKQNSLDDKQRACSVVWK